MVLCLHIAVYNIYVTVFILCDGIYVTVFIVYNIYVTVFILCDGRQLYLHIVVYNIYVTVFILCDDRQLYLHLMRIFYSILFPPFSLKYFCL